MSFWVFSFRKSMSMYFIFNFYFYFSLSFSFSRILYLTKKIIIDCSFPCLNCTGEGANCSSCIESFSLNDTTCISDYECTLSGYIENGTCYGLLPFFFFSFFIINILKWIGCNSNCSTCFGPTSNNCLSCSEPTYLMGEICLNSCPSSYYPANITQSCESKNRNENKYKINIK